MANADVTPDDVASEDGEDGDENAEGGKRGIPKKILIAAGAGGVVLLLGGGVGAAYMLGWIGAGPTPEELVLQQAQAPKFYYDLPELTVNLANAERRAQYLRLSVSLELSSAELNAAIEPNLPRILDVFQTYLRELRVSDLEGSAGLFRLKHELQRRVNLAIFPAEIEAVLFRELIVQ